ncbi:MAG: response regulator [Sedimentisphaerales bacterium]|nr:response regulator [Sedimentisphaerales bacterium]
MRFLIVEDDAVSRELLRLHLSDYGTCFEVPNGLLASEVIRNSLQEGEPFDAVFLDIMMPGMNGHEVLETLRQTEREVGSQDHRIKVIIVSALGDATNIMTAIQEGADGYIVKPVREENLLKELAKAALVPTKSHSR